jgi:predicted permease
MEDFLRDARYAVRSLARHKSFAATTVLTLALGIGANTAIFSVVSGVVLRPLPLPQPDRLVQLYETTPLSPQGGAVGWANLDAFRSQSTSFDALAGYQVSARYLRGPAGPERVMTVTAERDFFPMLGVAPLAGRTFRPDDAATVAVVGEAFWRRRFDADRSVIGRSVTFDGEPFTIVGVMPQSFQFPYGAGSLLPGVASEARTDFWLPLPPPAQAARTRGRISHVTGRLKPNVALATVQRELAAIAKRLETQYPDTNRERGVRLVLLSDAVVETTVRRPLFILFGAVGIVLALACANVTNLSLVRMTLRAREVAVRAALGATPRRLVRQFLTESLLLSLAGGATGLALAWWGVGRLMLLAGAQIPRAHEVNLDWRVFLFLFTVCALAGVVLGLAPAIIAVRSDTQSVLQQSGGHSTMGAGQRRLRDGLVVAEVALAFALAVGATLLIRELVRLRAIDTGMVTTKVMTFHLGHRMTPRTDVRQYYEIADRVAELPGVRAAGFTQMLPLQNWGWTSNSTDFRVRGRPDTQSPPFQVELRYVTPGYFQALGIPVRKGRGFTAADTRDAPPVILINETLARRYFADEDPVGRETTRGTIVGVVGDVRQVNLDRSAHPDIYYPIAQNWSQVSELGMSLVVRTENRPEAVIEPVRSVVRAVNPDLAIFNVRTMDGVIEDWLSDFTLYLSLMVSFALLALLLAATGTYGVISYVATSRTREFAIRVALGAGKTRVTQLVLRQAIFLTALGLGIGACVIVAATPLLQNLPITVRPPDVATLAPVALLIGTVAVVACLAPARRAANVDPMSMLRSE